MQSCAEQLLDISIPIATYSHDHYCLSEKGYNVSDFCKMLCSSLATSYALSPNIKEALAALTNSHHSTSSPLSGFGPENVETRRYSVFRRPWTIARSTRTSLHRSTH